MSELQSAGARGRVKHLPSAEANKAIALQADITTKAAKIGSLTRCAYKLLDKGAIDYSDDGKPTNTEDLLMKMLKERPYLAGGGTSAMNPAKNRQTEEEKIVAEARKWAGLK